MKLFSTAEHEKSVLIFKTIPRIRTRSIAGVLRPSTAATERYFRPEPFHITDAELREMKSAVWLPVEGVP